MIDDRGTLCWLTGQSEQLLTEKKQNSMAMDIEKPVYLARESDIFKY